MFMLNKKLIEWDYLVEQKEIGELVNDIRPNETSEVVNDYESNVLICLINPEIDFRAKIMNLVSALSDNFIITGISGNIIVALTNDVLIKNDENLFSDIKTIILRKKIHKAMIEAYIPLSLRLFYFSEKLLLDFKEMKFDDFICQAQGKEKTALISNIPKDLWWTLKNYESCQYLIFIGFINSEIFTEDKVAEIVTTLCKRKFIVSNTGFIGNIVTAYKKISNTKIPAFKIKGVKSVFLRKTTTIELLGDGKFLPFVPIYSFTEELIDKLLNVDYGDYTVIL